MPLGSVIALLCAFFVIFFLPYMEKKDKKKKWKSYYKVININFQNSLIKSSHKSLNLWLLLKFIYTCQILKSLAPKHSMIEDAYYKKVTRHVQNRVFK